MPPDLDQVARQVANLRLQMNAFETAMKSASLESITSRIRATVKWSALIIAVALLASSIIRMVTDEKTRSLEHRVEVLEKHLESR